MKRLISILLGICLALSGAISACAGTRLTLDINSGSAASPVSQTLYGVSLDDDNFSIDGGISADLVSNGSFENTQSRETGWAFSGLSAVAEKSLSMNSANLYYERITVDGEGFAENLGYVELKSSKGFGDDKALRADMGFVSGESYEFSCFLRNVDFEGSISVYLDSKGNSANRVKLPINNLSSGSWRRFSTKIRAAADGDGGLVIVFKGKGTICIDNVSLISESSYGYNQEQWLHTSLRQDVVRAISDLKPSFIRFSSCCMLKASSADKLASWKDTIGPVEQRLQSFDYWQGEGSCERASATVGFHEYFQLCEELYAKPVPVLSAGMVAQGELYELMSEAYDKSYMTEEQYFTYLENEKGFSRGNKAAMRERAEYIDSLGIKSADDWSKYIDSITIKPGTNEFSNYAQDILDLIEYANGDAHSSYWGSMRSANGHEEPFNLEYIAIGNENQGEAYYKNLEALRKIINKKYPDICIIACAGNSLDGNGADVSLGGNASGIIADEHFTADKGALLDSNNRYDGYDRARPRVMVGGFKSQGVNLISAVEEASFMTGVERNGDIVTMCAYAPSVSRINTSEDDSLILLDSRDIVLTPSYYSMLLFANNYGSSRLSTSISGLTDERLYHSVTVDESSHTVYIKIVNADSARRRLSIRLSGFENADCASALVMSGSAGGENSLKRQSIAPVSRALEIESGAMELTVDGCSVNVIRVGYDGNEGKAFYVLPDGISHKTGRMSRGNTALLLVIVVAVFLVSSLAGYLGYTRLVLKRQGREYRLFGRKKRNEE